MEFRPFVASMLLLVVGVLSTLTALSLNAPIAQVATATSQAEAPITASNCYPLRDVFAGEVAAAIVTADVTRGYSHVPNFPVNARQAYQQADALLKERSR